MNTSSLRESSCKGNDNVVNDSMEKGMVVVISAF